MQGLSNQSSNDINQLMLMKYRTNHNTCDNMLQFDNNGKCICRRVTLINAVWKIAIIHTQQANSQCSQILISALCCVDDVESWSPYRALKALTHLIKMSRISVSYIFWEDSKLYQKSFFAHFQILLERAQKYTFNISDISNLMKFIVLVLVFKILFYLLNIRQTFF